MKIIFKIILYLLLFFGFYAISQFIFGKKKSVEKSTDESVAETSENLLKHAEEMQMSNHLPKDYDWSTATIGEFLHPYLGNDTNWIIWTIIVLVVLWIITAIITTYFADKLEKIKGIKIGFFGFLLILVLGYAGYLAIDWKKITIFKKEPEAKVAKSSFVELKKFPRAVDGLELVVDMGVTQTAQIGLHMTNPRIHGNGKAFWACTEVIKPQVYADSLKFEVTPSTRGQYTNHIRLTKESRDMLIENGIMDIQVKFTQTLGAPKQSPCKHLT